jgi:hypothetical protein
MGITASGVAGIAATTGISTIAISSCKRKYSKSTKKGQYSTSSFAREVEQNLQDEEPYSYHKRLSTEPVHIPRRDENAQLKQGEMAIPDQGWKLVWNPSSSIVLKNAVNDFQDYLDKSHKVKVSLEELDLIGQWQNLRQSIIVGTRDQLNGCGQNLKSPKDYEIIVSTERIIICGYEERGAMFGLYNLEARLNLREAPFLPANLNTVRHSLYDTRMVLSWMGWMEWPDQLLSHLVHDGFDSIFASVYANPDGDRTTADTSTDFYARLLFRVRTQDPDRIRDLINRAARFGIKVYSPIIYQYLGTQESEMVLRKLVRDIVKKFPDIQGYILLTEGFWYKKWGGGHGAEKEYMKDWARNWCKAVSVVEEECHRLNPSIEILPWEYNIDFRPQNSDIKRYFIQQLPEKTIPLLTWENGKSFVLDGLSGNLRDYSLSQIGPAEVTDAQINEANLRGMKVYSKVDTFASWQFGTIPYLPCPYQWFDRYMALEKYGVKGTLESWSSGYKPNFISELRAWTCWTDAPQKEELFTFTANRIFGSENVELVLKAWEYFSQAISLVPDTGPNMGTNNAVGNPLFFQEPPLRTVTFNYSWSDFEKWKGYFGGGINPYWPFTVSRMVFYPDFTNKTNKAELYARSATGIQVGKEMNLLPVFLKYLKQAADKMEEGLKLYRTAAYKSPESKQYVATREVVVAEQLQRMMQSDHAILEFENLRLELMHEVEKKKAGNILDQMENIVHDEIDRTELSLLAATRDSRLGFQFEQDYVYTPYSLREKLEMLKVTLYDQLPRYRKKIIIS